MLTDRQIAKLSQDILDLKEERDGVVAKIDKLSGSIIKELERRGTKAIESDGVRVSYASSETVIYDIDKMQKKLSPALFKKITKPAIDKEGLAAVVEEGKISPEMLARYSEVRMGKPYIRISERGE